MYVRVVPSVRSVCHAASKENEKGFSEVLEGNGLERWNEIGDFVPRYTGRKLEELVFINQRELVEQPSDPSAIPIFQHFHSTRDDALL